MSEELSSGDNELKRAFREIFVIDFLGGMVPGVLFILACSAIVVACFDAVLNTVRKDPVSIAHILGSHFKHLRNTPSAMWLCFLIIFALVAFVIGHLFYRSDPKTPDVESIKLLCKNKSSTELKADLGAGSEEDCQFPYTHYDHYLKKRGHSHLLPLANWCETTDGHTRSKTFVNLLKIRLRYHFPEKFGIVIWNEAHIRMASSTWYVARVLRWLSLAGTIIAAAAAFALIKDFKSSDPISVARINAQVPNVIIPFLVFCFAWFAKRTTEEYLHYQRLREVFFVLETAFTAFRGRYELLSPPLSPVAVRQLEASGED